MKKEYISPEIDHIKITLGTNICSSNDAETPIPVIIGGDEEDLDDIV